MATPPSTEDHVTANTPVENNAETESRDASFLPPVTVPTLVEPIAKNTAPASTEPAAETRDPAPEPKTPSPVAATTEPAPASPPPTALQPIPAEPPVAATPLEDIDPQSVGTIINEEGSLGAGMWKGTSRALIERLLPSLTLPTTSATMNNLAQRFLLTTAGIPNGTATTKQSLISMRIEKLLALGNVTEAWKLAFQTKPELIDDITMRQIAEIGIAANLTDACSKLPDIMKAHAKADWQELMIVCQLRANDPKAAQLGLDVMRNQGIKDDVFYYLAEKSVIAGSKQLPRQLTPLKPLTLALLQLAQKPIPSEVYSHAPEYLIPPLLLATARDETPRISAAERAASDGLISKEALAAVYTSIPFAPDVLSNPAAASSMDAQHARALAYQLASKENQIDKKCAIIAAFFRNTPPALMGGAIISALTDLINDQMPPQESINVAATIAHLFLISTKPENADAWIKLAQKAAGSLDVLAELAALWPLIPLANTDTDEKFATNLAAWLDTVLQSTDSRAAKERAASTLLILQAAGFTISDEAWIRVADAPSPEKKITPSPLYLSRLQDSAAAEKRGEAVILGLLLANTNPKESTPLMTLITTIKALRQVGLANDALALAREAVNPIISASGKP